MLLAALAAMVLAQEVVPTAPAERPPPPLPAAPAVGPVVPPGDLSAAPPLPEGRLLPVATSDKGETFLVVDRASKSGDLADFWTYEAFIPPVEIHAGAKVVQGLTHHLVDCTAHTDRSVASAGYDETGVAIVALAAGPAAPLSGADGLIAQALCKERVLPSTGALQGHIAALAMARAPAGALAPGAGAPGRQ